MKDPFFTSSAACIQSLLMEASVIHGLILEAEECSKELPAFPALTD